MTETAHYLTPPAAAEKFCPQTFSKIGHGPFKCQGPACMGWRWAQEKTTSQFIKDCAERMRATGESANAAMQKVFAEKGASYEHIEGYCGLAGKPEGTLR